MQNAQQNVLCHFCVGDWMMDEDNCRHQTPCLLHFLQAHCEQHRTSKGLWWNKNRSMFTDTPAAHDYGVWETPASPLSGKDFRNVSLCQGSFSKNHETRQVALIQSQSQRNTAVSQAGLMHDIHRETHDGFSLGSGLALVPAPHHLSLNCGGWTKQRRGKATRTSTPKYEVWQNDVETSKVKGHQQRRQEEWCQTGSIPDSAAHRALRHLLAGCCPHGKPSALPNPPHNKPAAKERVAAPGKRWVRAAGQSLGVRSGAHSTEARLLAYIILSPHQWQKIKQQIPCLKGSLQSQAETVYV